MAHKSTHGLGCSMLSIIGSVICGRGESNVEVQAESEVVSGEAEHSFSCA